MDASKCKEEREEELVSKFFNRYFNGTLEKIDARNDAEPDQQINGHFKCRSCVEEGSFPDMEAYKKHCNTQDHIACW